MTPAFTPGFTPSSIAALVIAVSFAAGLNVYATVLTLGLLARAHWVMLPPGLESLGHWWVIGVAGALFAAEFVADKIPGFDLLWNALHTFIRIPVAALMAYHATAQLSPQMQILAAACGGVIALVTHSSKTAVRAAVTPSPEPFSNIALSTGEDIGVVSLTWLATQHPWVAAGIALALLAVAMLAARWLAQWIGRWLRQMRNRPSPAAQA
ncbi:DUF4126 domain-containing protein [Silvibacterium dinghuense]|uniref:DUF4126 domain-containing protein n=1 Tax=Silvibacterium dinghuense TaxID=1560006 RepID=A0A4Q1SGK3_9BACT|nr:DUF4126 domain-containing protein [Silvibacterium dinghuense]RXS96658.1 DUF4126 domain-containing protein [Silvibacterium dinghuense]GGG92589.1 membrane protein [Silvibacterium dinghuense]